MREACTSVILNRNSKITGRIKVSYFLLTKHLNQPFSLYTDVCKF